MKNLESITFDKDDKTLFTISDLQLKADAIRYSVLPKLEIIANELVSRIIEIYKVDYFGHSSFGKSPHFRKSNRLEELKTDYDSASVSLTGQRKWEKWFGLKRKGEKPANIVPFQIAIDLSEEGLSYQFFFGFPRNFTIETYQKFYNFIIENERIIQTLLFKSQLFPLFEWNEDNGFITTFSEKLKWKIENNLFDLNFVPVRVKDFPIIIEDIEEAMSNCIIIFPLYQAFIDISVGIRPNIMNYVERYNEWLLSNYDKEPESTTEIEKIKLTNDEIDGIVNNKIKVQAGMRWYVFKRDNWKCVACGRSAEDGIILHIDHIVPRSKGGKDEIENYQTLCNICNIGKSNKDETNLRNRTEAINSNLISKRKTTNHPS